MKYHDLIMEWLEISRTNQQLNYLDILTEDFTFKTPLREIKGNINFMNLEIDRNPIVMDSQLLHLFENLEQDIYHAINRIQFLGEDKFDIVTHQTISITGGLISSVEMSVNNLSNKLTTMLTQNS